MGKPGDPHGIVSKVLDFKLGRMNRPPVPLEKCPWCYAPLVADCFSLHPSQDKAEELRIGCLNDDCDFTGDHPLPIQMVDEPIYRRLPGFLIATVDKFAAMPWRGEVAKLFGRVKSFGRGVGFFGDCDDRVGAEVEGFLPPPELIIQDELHLISGPLGTVTGLYETAISKLCEDRHGHGPKIVSSTATVRRAADQIRSLFGRGTVEIFPPPRPGSSRLVLRPDGRREGLGPDVPGPRRAGPERQASPAQDLSRSNVGGRDALSGQRRQDGRRQPGRSVYDDARLLQQPARARRHAPADRGRADQPPQSIWSSQAT